MKKKLPCEKSSSELVSMQDEIRRRANYSLAIEGMGFVRHGSGDFLNLRRDEEYSSRYLHDRHEKVS